MMHRQTAILEATDDHQRRDEYRNEAIGNNSQYGGCKEETNTPSKDFLESIHAKKGDADPNKPASPILFCEDIAEIWFYIINYCSVPFSAFCTISGLA